MSKKNMKERGRFLKDNLRMASASGQPSRPDQHAKVRGKIARLKTVMNESRSAK
jgi:ribosomal protein L29